MSDVVVLDGDVRVYPPRSRPYWRVLWYEAGVGRQERNRRTKREAMALAQEASRQLRAGSSALNLDARMAEGIDIYLDPDRIDWSPRHRQRQEEICRLWLTPVASLRIGDLSPASVQRVLASVRAADRATGTVEKVGACLRAVVTVAWDYGYLPYGQNPLRGVRFRQGTKVANESVHLVAEDEIPDCHAVGTLASAMAARTGEWWRALEVKLSAYSGLRLGEKAALRACDITTTPHALTIDVARQVIELDRPINGRRVFVTQPKGRRRRTTIYPTC